MLFSIGLLIVIVFIAFRIAPVENKENAAVHGAGQIGLLAAVALFGVDYFTSYFYATGELMSALHPYGEQKYGYINGNTLKAQITGEKFYVQKKGAVPRSSFIRKSSAANPSSVETNAGTKKIRIQLPPQHFEKQK